MTRDELRELFGSGSGHAVLTVSLADYRWLRRLLGERYVWELRKRGKKSRKNRRKRHGR